MYQQKSKKSFINHITEFISLALIVFFIRTFFFGLYQVPTPSMEDTMLVGERFVADKLTYWFREPRRGEIIAFNDPEYVYSKNKFVQLFERYVWGPSNWTKRVVAAPGDTIEGRIEEGKPVIYVNGSKLNESYLNKFPLIHVWTEDPQLLRRNIEKELAGIMRTGISGIDMERIFLQKAAHKITSRSYDPEKSFYDQPYYRIDERRIIRGADGKPELLWPATPLQQKENERKTGIARYWNKTDTFYIQQLGADEYWVMGDNRLASKDSRFLGPIKKKEIHGRIFGRLWSHDSDESWAILDLLKHPIDFWKRMRWSRFFQFVY